MRTLGIDLASQSKKTAACEIEWNESAATVSLVEVGVDDRRAIRLMRGADVVGIDAPFGWPLPFVDWIRRHHAEGGGTAEWTTEYKNSLRFRRTDLLVQERLKLWPLSVSSDRIAITAMRCAGLLDRLGVVDRSGSAHVVEVYPAVALKAWELTSQGYKGASKQNILADLLAKLMTACPALTVPSAYHALCASNDHAFDALVSALVSRAAAVGLTERPEAADLPLARTEGWIAVPCPDSLALLSTADRSVP